MTDSSMVDPHLDDDVLSVIFTFLAEKTRSSFRDVVSISHVCKQWRQVSVYQTPELWRRYAFLSKRDGTMDPQFSEEMLCRCGALTLDVGWEWDHEPYAGSNTTATDAIIAHTPVAHRLRSYSLLLAKDRSELLRAQKFLNTWNPALMQELTVRERVQGDRIRRFFDCAEVELTSLRKLTLHRCWIEIDRGVSIPNLQSFTAIVFSAGPMIPGEGFPSTFHGWLQYLAKWPQLSSFRLQFMSPAADHIASRANQVSLTQDLLRESRLAIDVSLPHLTDINLTIYYHDLEIFLDKVTCPPARRAVFHIYASRPGPLPNLENRIRQIVSRHGVPSRTKGNRLTISVAEKGTSCGVSYSKRKVYRTPLAGHPSEDVTISIHPLQSEGVNAPLKTYLAPLVDGWLGVMRKVTSLRLDAEPGTLPDGFDRTLNKVMYRATMLESLYCRNLPMVVELLRRHGTLTDFGNGLFLYKVLPPYSFSNVSAGPRLQPLNPRPPSEIRIATYE